MFDIKGHGVIDALGLYPVFTGMISADVSARSARTLRDEIAGTFGCDSKEFKAAQGLVDARDEKLKALREEKSTREAQEASLRKRLHDERKQAGLPPM